MSHDLEEATLLLQQASIWQADGKIERAEEAYRRVLTLDPANPDALNLLAIIHHTMGDRATAVNMLQRASKIAPSARVFNNLGVVLAAMGDRNGSLASYRRSINTDVANIDTWTNLMFALDLHPLVSPQLRLQDRRAFNDRICAGLTASAPPHTNDPDPERRLKIGYVSADFRNHSASIGFGPAIDGHSKAVETHLYATHPPSDDDNITEHFRERADVWHAVSELDDDELAAQIRADQIDIAVDLSGYSGGNRILTFARKPAPIQMTGWGHAVGVSIDAIDYLLVDEITVPPEHEVFYHEKIIHLPCTVAYDTRPPYPEVGPPPLQRNGHVTFGYLGRAHKINDQVIATWAEIMRRVPHSRLLLKHADYLDESYRTSIMDRLIALRIGTPRVTFQGGTGRASHLNAYNECDIILDPFPHGGGITTLDCCLMGVASVTLLGDNVSGRISASLFNVIGNGGVVATTIGDYIAEAVELAQNVPDFEARRALRYDLLHSVVCDPKVYASHVEDAYRTAWRQWCWDQTS